MSKLAIDTFLGPQLGLLVAGDYAYSYSGVIAVGGAGINVATTMSEFVTGNYTFVGLMQYFRGTQSNTGHDYLHIIKLNGQSIIEIADSSSGTFEQDMPNLIIPPRTQVIATSQNATTGADNDIIFTFTGSLYR